MRSSCCKTRPVAHVRKGGHHRERIRSVTSLSQALRLRPYFNTDPELRRQQLVDASFLRIVAFHAPPLNQAVDLDCHSTIPTSLLGRLILSSVRDFIASQPPGAGADDQSDYGADQKATGPVVPKSATITAISKLSPNPPASVPNATQRMRKWLRRWHPKARAWAYRTVQLMFRQNLEIAQEILSDRRSERKSCLTALKIRSTAGLRGLQLFDTVPARRYFVPEFFASLMDLLLEIADFAAIRSEPRQLRNDAVVIEPLANEVRHSLGETPNSSIDLLADQCFDLWAYQPGEVIVEIDLNVGLGATDIEPLQDGER